MQIFINEKEVLEIKDAADKAKITVRWLYKLLNDNTIQSVHHDRRRFVVKESLDEYLKSKGSNNVNTI